MAKKKLDLKVASLNLIRYKVAFLMEKMADYNPRSIDDDAKSGLSYSIEHYGYLENIVFNKKTETIVSGHQRIQILNEQGYDEVDVHEIHVSREVEKELNITMNNMKIHGSFTHQLSDLLREISESNPELYDMTNMVSLDFEDMVDDDEEFADIIKEDHDEIKEMELMPYEHYDCLVVVFKRTDDFLYLKGRLGLGDKKIISATAFDMVNGHVIDFDAEEFDFIFDGHTRKGKAMGRGREFFFEHSVKIEEYDFSKEPDYKQLEIDRIEQAYKNGNAWELLGQAPID